MKLVENKAITLIALIITIIILLVLASVSISVLLGDNGLLDRAVKAREESKKSQVKEEIELGIYEIQVDEISNGRDVNLERLSGEEKLLENKLPGITADLQENKIIGKYKEYNYEVDENFGVTVKEKIEENIDVVLDVDGTKNENEWYKTNVKVRLECKKQKNMKVQKLVFKLNENDEVKVNQESTEATIEDEGINTISYYAVLTNGEQSEKKEKKIKIDKTEPTDVKVKAQEVGENKITVEMSAIENNSGIDKYEIYVNDLKKKETTKSVDVIDGLLSDTSYNICVQAIDKAGNVSEKSPTITIKTIDVYVHSPIVFEAIAADTVEGSSLKISMVSFLFDNSLNNSPYGAVMLNNYQNTYLRFSTEKSVKIEAYGEVYVDFAGNSKDTRAKINKYNYETQKFEEYKIISTKSKEWYEFAVLEPGKYEIKAVDAYVRFDEWKIKEQ